MNIRLRFSFAVALVATSAVLLAQPLPPAPAAGAPGSRGPGGAPGGQPAAEKTPLAEHMTAISELFTALGMQISDMAKKEDSLAKLATIRSNFVAASKLTPAYYAQQPETNKVKFMEDFHNQMAKMLKEIDLFEASLKAGNAADAQTHYTGMRGIRGESHPEFRAPRGRGGPGGAPGGPGGPGGAGAPGGQPRGANAAPGAPGAARGPTTPAAPRGN